MKKKVLITVSALVVLSLISFTVLSLNNQKNSEGDYIPIVEKDSLFFWIE